MLTYQMPIGLASVEGGGKWANRADDVICIHRYTSSPTDWMYSHLHVLKVKENETGGRCTPFEEPIRLRMAKNNVCNVTISFSYSPGWLC